MHIVQVQPLFSRGGIQEYVCVWDRNRDWDMLKFSIETICSVNVSTFNSMFGAAYHR